ncbi:hypothetical protein CDAR_193031 [Caerostris darwini]|uniref:Uncharacterized protein n=1 Tax=Caerostris darwini TaxID=1538125 RepID=A0AAV4U099_9ARAC|nr:hypothetical protein CDAR_193031 [Caerostris darwini]
MSGQRACMERWCSVFELMQSSQNVMVKIRGGETSDWKHFEVESPCIGMKSLTLLSDYVLQQLGPAFLLMDDDVHESPQSSDRRLLPGEWSGLYLYGIWRGTELRIGSVLARP